VQNAFAVLKESDDDKDADVATVIMQMAALTMQSQLTAASTAAATSLVTAAIHQLNSNQQAMMQQMATYTNANTAHNLPAAHNPPLTHFNIPAIGTFQPGGNAQGGRRPGRGRGGRAPVISPGGRRAPRTPFANYSARQGGMGASIVSAFVPGAPGVGMAARNTAPMYSNIVKRYANMNVCFSCGFDVENRHTSRTCPQAWRRVMPSNKSMRGRCGAEQVDNHLCQHDITTYASDPVTCTVNDSDDATVITSNTSCKRNVASACNIASTLRQGVPKTLAFSDTQHQSS